MFGEKNYSHVPQGICHYKFNINFVLNIVQITVELPLLNWKTDHILIAFYVC